MSSKSLGDYALVTGGNGFLGQAISKELRRRNFNVVSLVRHQQATSEKNGITTRSWSPDGGVDLDDLVAEAKAVFHCAGAASVAESIARPVDDWKSNTNPLLTVLEAIRRTASKTQLILISSASVYGPQLEQPILTSARPNPMSPYGFSKLSAELLAQEYSQCFGVNSISVRPFSLYGPGLKKQLLWDACNKFSKGIGEFFGTGEEVRDWLHVEDASSMIVDTMNMHASRERVLNIASGVGVTNKKIIQTLARAFGFGEISFSTLAKAGDPQIYVADISNNPISGRRCVELEVGLHQYVDWFKAQDGIF